MLPPLFSDAVIHLSIITHLIPHT